MYTYIYTLYAISSLKHFKVPDRIILSFIYIYMLDRLYHNISYIIYFFCAMVKLNIKLKSNSDTEICFIEGSPCPPTIAGVVLFLDVLAQLSICISYVHIYIYMYTYTHIYIYVDKLISPVWFFVVSYLNQHFQPEEPRSPWKVTIFFLLCRSLISPITASLRRNWIGSLGTREFCGKTTGKSQQNTGVVSRNFRSEYMWILRIIRSKYSLYVFLFLIFISHMCV